MRRWVVVTALGVAACGGNTAASDRVTPAQTVALRDFDAVALDGPDTVDVMRGQDFAVAIDGPPEVRRKLTLRRDGNVLRIGRKSGGIWTVDRGVARIRVTMPSIEAATLSGSGDMAIDQAADPFVATLSGSGDMTIGQLRGDKATLTVSGSGSIAAAGSVRDLTLSVAGSGNIAAQQLRADAATVVVTGSGDVAAQVEGPARVSLVGSGSADLGTGARCTVDRVGTGEAHCG
ncbi:MAG: DUF2807 domain-containing protein [Sphingomonas paucimobilis]